MALKVHFLQRKCYRVVFMLGVLAANELDRSSPYAIPSLVYSRRINALSPTSKTTSATMHLSIRKRNLLSTSSLYLTLMTQNDTYTVRHYHKSITGIEWFHDIGMFSTIGADNSLKLWDTEVLEPAYTFGLFNHVLKHSWSSSGLIAAGGETSRITILDPSIGSSSHVLRGHTGGVTALHWSPVVDYILASGGMDGVIRIWDIRKADACLIEYNHLENTKSSLNSTENIVKAVLFTFDGLTLLSTGGRKLKAWNDISSTEANVKFDLNLPKTHSPTANFTIVNVVDTILYPTRRSITMINLKTGSYYAKLEGHLVIII